MKSNFKYHSTDPVLYDKRRPSFSLIVPGLHPPPSRPPPPRPAPAQISHHFTTITAKVKLEKLKISSLNTTHFVLNPAVPYWMVLSEVRGCFSRPTRAASATADSMLTVPEVTMWRSLPASGRGEYYSRFPAKIQSRDHSVWEESGTSWCVLKKWWIQRGPRGPGPHHEIVPK